MHALKKNTAPTSPRAFGPRATNPRAFVYRAGVRIAGTVVACDASAGSDLVFLSHAAVLGARGRRALPRLGGGRRQILSTDTTLSLLGPVGDRLRAQALIAAYGRPFALGETRLELFASGYLPGAASLLCERGGRRVVYAGPIGEGAEVRAADAVCLDARFAAPGRQFPERRVAEDNLRQAVAQLRAAGGATVLLVEPTWLALSVAQLLGADGVALRAHRSIMDAAASYRAANLPAAALQRFAGRLAPGEVLLWPASAPAPHLAGARAVGRVLISPQAEWPGVREQVDVSRQVTFPLGADLPRLLEYVAATGASEVALVGATGDGVAELLRGRGLEVYRLGPPSQIDLFAAA